jgi:hypothetical protein
MVNMELLSSDNNEAINEMLRKKGDNSNGNNNINNDSKTTKKKNVNGDKEKPKPLFPLLRNTKKMEDGYLDFLMNLELPRKKYQYQDESREMFVL